MIKVPKKTSSTLLQSSIDFLKLGWAWNGATQKYLVQQPLGSKKDCSRPPEKKTFGDWSVFINLLQSRLSFVSQIYTSVLKTKVKLIEYAFETLPAWILSMPPSKARKYNQIINNVGGKLKASHNWLKTRYREKKIHNCCFSYSFTVFHFSRV